jgi:pyridoxal 5'-phosphate synthase pdxT subunit
VTTRVGILGFQGCIEPHETMLAKLGVETLRVRTKEELASADRLILPGGESSTMLRFLKLYDLVEPLKEFGRAKPIWGICAGSILLAQEVHNPQQDSLGLINISAHRNFYGSQLDSFTTHIEIAGLAKTIPAQFIRAPLLNRLAASSVHGEAEVLACCDEQPVFFTQNRIWACSFHVELGEDTSLHEMFLKL